MHKFIAIVFSIIQQQRNDDARTNLCCTQMFVATNSVIQQHHNINFRLLVSRILQASW